MLSECNHTIEDRSGTSLRWYNDSFFDLDIWIGRDGSIREFMLCYNKPRDPHAILWTSGSGYTHYRVDDGESRPGRTKSSAILTPDGPVEVVPLALRFLDESREIDPALAGFVYRKLIACPIRRPPDKAGFLKGQHHP